MSSISAPNTGDPSGVVMGAGAVAAAHGVRDDEARALHWPLPAGLLGVLAGTALQLQQAQLWTGGVYGAVLALAGLCALGAMAVRRARIGAVVGLAGWCLAGLLGAGALAGLRASAFAEGALAPALEGRDVRVVGRVVAMPQPNEAGVRLRLAVESAHLAGEPVRLPELIDLAWYGGPFRGPQDTVDLQRTPPPLRAGERWAMTVRLKAPHGLRNPHGFDYELWMWEQGVQATGYVRAGPRDEAPQRLARTAHHPVEQVRQAVRDAILERLLPRDAPGVAAGQARTAGIVAALVTGDQRAIDRADWDVFRATGVAHLVSISGLHITLFAWLAAAGVGALWRRSARLCRAVPAPLAALGAGVLLATAYALFSGWGVPAQRTVLMLATVAVLRCSGRQWPWPQVWLLACAVVLLVDPWALAQAGFWLSFVAVGVLFASSSIATNQYGSGASRYFVAMLREQWVVTLALTPLTLLLFGQVSLVSLLANLVAIPWVTLVVTPLALAGVLWAPVWTAAAAALQPLHAWLQWLAAWPWAVAYLPAAPLWAGAAAVAGGTLMALRVPWQVRAMALPLLLPVLWWQPARPAVGTFELTAVDIGQGNAVLVRTAGHAMLYDTGPRFSRESDAGHRVLVPLLRAWGERLDLVMLSHRDADHTGGAGAVLAQQPQARLTGSIEVEHALHAQRPGTPCLAGQQWEWDGVRFDVLHPLPGDDRTGVRPNALSCVLRITPAVPGHGTALLAGDIESAQEQALLARGATVRADLLLVPHHGSKTSSSAAFLDAVRPGTALVQAGYRNRFGHPAAPVLQRYDDRGIRVVESARCGAATWSAAQPDQMRCEREAQRRYWHHAPAARTPAAP